jgi:hypothetical protein
MTDAGELFARQKYVVWRSCLKDPQLSLLYRYACKRADSGTMGHDARSPGAWAAPGDFFTDGLLMDLLPLAEEVTDLKLFPTYSYFRVYKRGDILVRHTDRPSCEISVTLCLGYEADGPWPIFLDGPGRVSSIELCPGDALFYRGVECTHWREPMEGKRAAQAFLHYVDQNGPYAEWKFDKRAAIPFNRPAPTKL